MSKTIKMGFDISTKKMGWCVLVDEKPIKYKINHDNIDYSFGSLKLFNNEIIYKNWGDRMIKGTRPFLIQFYNVLSSVIDAVLIKIDKTTPNIIIALEFNQMNNLETSTKLALFVGKISQVIENIIYKKLKDRINNIEFKLVSANEWQKIYDDDSKKDWSNKKRTLKLANIMFEKLWNISPITIDDDLADAINLAFVAEKVRDNLTIKEWNKEKQKLKNRLKTLYNRKEYWFKKANLIHKVNNYKNNDYKYDKKNHYQVLKKRERESLKTILNKISEIENKLK